MASSLSGCYEAPTEEKRAACHAACDQFDPPEVRLQARFWLVRCENLRAELSCILVEHHGSIGFFTVSC